MSEVFLSIIVPVYQVEPYIARCLESLLHQQVPGGYEVILVDDGTKDDSIHVAQKLLEQKDPEVRSRVRIIHRKNGGLSAARNTGIAASRGEYLQFVDSDDALSDHSLEAVCRTIQEQNLDLLLYDEVQIEMRNGTEHALDQEGRHFPSDRVDSEPVPGLELMAEMVDGGRLSASACGYIFRRSLLDPAGSSLRFCEGILHEDELFTPQLLFAARRTKHVRSPLYLRYVREGSITTDRNMIPRIHGLAKAAAGLDDFYEQHHSDMNEREQKAFLINLEQLCRHILGEGSKIPRRQVRAGSTFREDLKKCRTIFRKRKFRADLPFRLYLIKNRIVYR